jgi:formate dehydrogenase major subunit
MLQHVKDLGTPIKIGLPVSLTIDGRPVTVATGTSVMHAAALAGIAVPKLCATDSLEAFGSCRVCLVEIEGRKGYPASCTTEVEEGMEVRTRSERLDDLRRNVVELYVSDHPLDCDSCSANGECELQDVAASLGVEESRYGPGKGGYRDVGKDSSNPYFSFDPAQCIVCYRCVRACDDIQGTFALTVDGRGYASRVTAGQNESFMDSDCVSCGACVNHCPTEALIEKSVVEQGLPDRRVTTTCAYCGVGCSFHAELQGDQVLRMTPDKAGQANEGHACVKGRFAFGYATHHDRITRPMIRDSIDEPWREVSWDEAFDYTAGRLRAIQQQYGPDSIGGITSSRCTNEETYLVQKMVRAAFGNNNVDTCARVCHSPTGYGLKTTLGESAGTQAFHSVAHADVIMVMGANPSDAHPVFASRLKRRLREGARLIVVDPRRIELVGSPHIRADHHLALRPGSNVAFINAMAHVVVTEGLEDRGFIEDRCEEEPYRKWRDSSPPSRTRPKPPSGSPASRQRNSARRPGCSPARPTPPFTMASAFPSTARARPRSWASPTSRWPPATWGARASASIRCAARTTCRAPATPAVRNLFEAEWGVALKNEPGLRIPNMFDASMAGHFKGLYVQGEDVAQSDPNIQHVEAALRGLECLVVQDLFLNETARFAHVFLPGTSFLEKDGTFTNAERRISRVRTAIEPLPGLADWEVTMALSRALGYPMAYRHPSEIMDEIARLTPTFAGVSYAKLDRLGSIQWPCDDTAPEGTPTMHVDQFVRGKGYFAITGFVPTDEVATRRYPLLLTTGRILSQYNVGAQTRRTPNSEFYSEDVLEIHPFDAEGRGIGEGDWCGVASRAGNTVLRAVLTDRVQPGVVYTTFHFPSSGANVITTDNSDWATNCPEYKVTAVQVTRVAEPSSWQKEYRAFARRQEELLDKARA